MRMDQDYHRSALSDDTDTDDESDPQSPAVETAPSSPPLMCEDIMHAKTSLLELISAVDRRCLADVEPDVHGDSVEDDTDSVAPTWDSLPRFNRKNFDVFEHETKSLGAVEAYGFLDLYFTRINPLYPCLNENSFRLQHEIFLAPDNCQMRAAERYQFAAQLNLMSAIVKILKADCPDSRKVPGWQDFCRAEDIMYPLIWLGNGDVMTLQCLIMKAMYLLYMERAESSYETMGHAVRLCFQLGLHNESTWTTCTSFEFTMRQRIFWSVLCLERHVAFNSGAPYLIRETDYKVGFPKPINDKWLYKDQPVPEETPDQSFVPYLIGAGKWSKLCSEIWDKMFGVNATEKGSLEFIASTDARILYAASTLPTCLRWRDMDEYCMERPNESAYLPRQRLILFMASHFRS